MYYTWSWDLIKCPVNKVFLLEVFFKSGCTISTNIHVPTAYCLPMTPLALNRNGFWSLAKRQMRKWRVKTWLSSDLPVSSNWIYLYSGQSNPHCISIAWGNRYILNITYSKESSRDIIQLKGVVSSNNFLAGSCLCNYMHPIWQVSASLHIDWRVDDKCCPDHKSDAYNT